MARQSAKDPNLKATFQVVLRASTSQRGTGLQLYVEGADRGRVRSGHLRVEVGLRRDRRPARDGLSPTGTRSVGRRRHRGAGGDRGDDRPVADRPRRDGQRTVGGNRVPRHGAARTRPRWLGSGSRWWAVAGGGGRGHLRRGDLPRRPPGAAAQAAGRQLAHGAPRPADDRAVGSGSASWPATCRRRRPARRLGMHAAGHSRRVEPNSEGGSPRAPDPGPRLGCVDLLRADRARRGAARDLEHPAQDGRDPPRTATAGVAAASASVPLVVAGWLLLGRPDVPPAAGRDHLGAGRDRLLRVPGGRLWTRGPVVYRWPGAVLPCWPWRSPCSSWAERLPAPPGAAWPCCWPACSSCSDRLSSGRAGSTGPARVFALLTGMDDGDLLLQHVGLTPSWLYVDPVAGLRRRAPGGRGRGRWSPAARSPRSRAPCTCRAPSWAGS